MDAIDTIDYKGYKIEIHSDSDDSGESPRDWDNLGAMVCFHRRYELGDKNHGFSSPDEFTEFLQSNKKSIIAIPLYLMDHSGITMRAGRAVSDFIACDSAGWDWGMVGYIYVTYDNIRKEYNKKRVSKQLKDRVYKHLCQEVETYDQYLTGDIYGYMVINPDGEDIDSCWGFYGHDHKASGLLEYAQNAVDCAIEQEQEYYDKLQLRFDLALA